MYTRRFFIAATLIPLLLMLFAVTGSLMSSSEAWINILVMLLVPYMVFAGLMILAGLKLSVKGIRRLSYRTPVILLLIQCGYILLRFWLELSIAKDAIGLAGVLIFTSVFYTIVGYLYVFIMEQGFISYLFQRRSRDAWEFNKNRNKNRLVC